MSLIPTQIESFLKIRITHVIKVNNSSKSNLMIRFFVFEILNLFAFFFCRRIPKSCCMDEDIFWETLYRDNFFLVFDIKSVKVSP